MRTARDNLHIDGHRSPLALGNAESFEQTAHRTAFWNGAFLAINKNLDHRP
jgi:hypothetical protein